MQQQITTQQERLQLNVREFVETKRKTATMRPATTGPHATSSVMMPALRRSIEDSMRAGREPKYVAAEYGATQVLCVWLWTRVMFSMVDRRLAALEDSLGPTGRMRLVA